MDLSEVDLFEQQVRPLRLSEAIRRGAKLRPQGFGRNCPSASCALQAAHEAVTGKHITPVVVSTWAAERFNIPMNIIRGITNLNDVHRHSRESIADYLEGLGY